MFEHIIANAEDTKVSAVFSIDKMTTPTLNSGGAQGDKPEIEKGYNQGEARQTHEVPKTAFLQVEAMALEITKHLFDPHPSFVEAHSNFGSGQVGSEKPRGGKTGTPDGQEVGGTLMLLSQLHILKPNGLSRASDQAVDPLPGSLFSASYIVATFLAQYVSPSPVVQEFLEGCELAIACHHNRHCLGHQLVDVTQQRFLLTAGTVSLFVSDPGPSQRQCPSTISDGHHQQLMAISHLCRVDNQLYRLSFSLGLYQQTFSDWLVPLPYSDVTVVQKAGDTTGTTAAHCLPRYLAGNVAQMHRPTCINAGHEPSKIPEPRYVFHWKHLSNLPMKGMICLDDGHFCLLFRLVLLPFTLTGFVAIVSFSKYVG